MSCEHGGNRVPARWAPLFARAGSALESHRGWDPGALAVARGLARRLGCPLHAATVSRLLVELNRSLGHPRLFSEFTRALPAAEKEEILARHYHPFREAVAGDVARGGRVLHLSVHTFVPVLAGRRRTAGIGLLYDPARPSERALCAAWKGELAERRPGVVVRRNYPYRGTSDGLTTALRRRFPDARYAGVELELNQRLVVGRNPHRLVDALAEVVRGALR